jgi:hypothetical protein
MLLQHSAEAHGERECSLGIRLGQDHGKPSLVEHADGVLDPDSLAKGARMPTRVATPATADPKDHHREGLAVTFRSGLFLAQRTLQLGCREQTRVGGSTVKP